MTLEYLQRPIFFYAHILTGSGSFRMRGKKFRFLVMPRYGTDLQTLLDDSGSTLSVDTACSIGTQVVSIRLFVSEIVGGREGHYGRPWFDFYSTIYNTFLFAD